MNVNNENFFYNSFIYFIFLINKNNRSIKNIKNNININKFNGYLECTSNYLNHFDNKFIVLNPDYFDTEEKINKIIIDGFIKFVLNKPFYINLLNNISLKMKLKSNYSNIISKYIMKYIFYKNRVLSIKGILYEIYEQHIFYTSNNKEYFIYLNNSKNEESEILFEDIRKCFLNYNEKLYVYYKIHFCYIDHKYISRIDEVVNT